MPARTILRALEPEDLDLLYTIENDRQLWWVGTQTAPYSRYRLRDYIANAQNDIYKDEQVRFVIEADNKAVGLIDLFNFSPKEQRAEVGIALLAEAQGRGVAHEALTLLIQYARDILHLHQIYAIVPTTNTPSIHLHQATSFKPAAQLKDWLQHSGKYEDAILMQLIL